MKAVLIILAYPIESCIVNKTAYQTLSHFILFIRYSTFKIYETVEKIVIMGIFSKIIRSMDSNRIVEVRGFEDNFASNFFLIFFL